MLIDGALCNKNVYDLSSGIIQIIYTSSRKLAGSWLKRIWARRLFLIIAFKLI